MKLTLKDQIISYALDTICDIYKAKKHKVLSNKNRIASTMKAKRMFLYYLNKHMEVRHSHMKKYFKSINHATSIHHVNKFEYELFNYNDTNLSFNTFIKKMKKFHVYGEGITKKRNQIRRLQNKLNKIKNEEN